MRLNGREWIAVGLIVAFCAFVAPRFWERVEPLNLAPNDRVPYAASEDYWIYEHTLRHIVRGDHIPILGDSFVWGEYVPADGSFSSLLNATTGSKRFANVGLNGAHPLALCGLIENYATALRDRPVLLHCNLLWMSSPERDLQSDEEMPFNHPRLVPQFIPRIAAYRAPLARRLGIVVDRNIPLFQLADHIRFALFGGSDLYTWSISHPYDVPQLQRDDRAVNRVDPPHSDSVPWTKQGLERQDMPWVDLQTSLQWRAWRQAAQSLRSKGNIVLVVLGPFNEHLLTPPSRARYQIAKQSVEAWLRDNGFPFIAPALLPSEEYGDASHPLHAGYARLAKEVAANPVFQQWIHGL